MKSGATTIVFAVLSLSHLIIAAPVGVDVDDLTKRAPLEADLPKRGLYSGTYYMGEEPEGDLPKRGLYSGTYYMGEEPEGDLPKRGLYSGTYYMGEAPETGSH